MDERFGSCLEAWMKEKGLTAAALAVKTGYKSKNTVVRFLNGNCSYQRCRDYYALLQEAFVISAPWADRFNRALLVEKNGYSRYLLYRTIYGKMIENHRDPYQGRTEAEPAGDTPSEWIVLGCPGEETFALAADILARSPRARIDHYLTEAELLSCSEVLRGLITLLTEERYHAYLVEAPGTAFLTEDRERKGNTWNAAFCGTPGEETRILIWVDGAFLPFRAEASGGEDRSFETIRRQVSGIHCVPLYRFGRLETGEDYLKLMQACRQNEKDRQMLIFRPALGIQMIPYGMTARGFRSALAERSPFSVAELDEVISILRDRVKNFYSRRQKTCMIFCWEGMLAFVRTGKMTDQMEMLKPYSMADRREILARLLSFAREDHCALYFLKEGGIPPYCYETYQGAGVLIYPSGARYDTRRAPYRELFVPIRTAEEMMEDFTMDALIPIRCLDREASLEKLRSLLEKLENEGDAGEG